MSPCQCWVPSKLGPQNAVGPLLKLLPGLPMKSLPAAQLDTKVKYSQKTQG